MQVQPLLSMIIVGQLGVSGGGIVPLMLWAGVLMIVVVVSAIGLAWIRRQLVSSGDDDTGEGWSLHSLREVHGRGEITDEEFERAKDVVLGGMNKGSAGSPDHPRGVDLTGDPLPKRSSGKSESSGPGDEPQVP